MARRLKLIADGPIVGQDKWQVLDAETGEPIAGVCAVRIEADAGGRLDGKTAGLARIVLHIHALDVETHINWGENSCSSPTDES